MKRATIAVFGISLLIAWLVPALAQPAAQTVRIRGDVVALDGLNLQVKTRGGEALSIKLAENYTVNAVVKIDIVKIVPGTSWASPPCRSPTARSRRWKSSFSRNRDAAAAKDTIPGICSPGA